MIKSWLITTSAPFCGTDQYYCAFCKEDPVDNLDDWFYDEEVWRLWEDYSMYADFSEDDDDYEERLEEWLNECNMIVSECSIEELEDYGYDGELPEILIDERNGN